MTEQAFEKGATFFCQGNDFQYQKNHLNWSWQFKDIHYHNLPFNGLLIQNMSTVLMAITLLQDCLNITPENIETGLTKINIKGRIQIINEPIIKIFDVSHNPAAVSLLAKRLKEIPCPGKTRAVFSMLMDKDIVESIRCIKENVDHWYVAPLSVKRGASKETLQEAFHKTHVQTVNYFATIYEAYSLATQEAKPNDRIVVFGSFHTVADVLQHITVRK